MPWAAGKTILPLRLHRLRNNHGSFVKKQHLEPVCLRSYLDLGTHKMEIESLAVVVENNYSLERSLGRMLLITAL